MNLISIIGSYDEILQIHEDFDSIDMEVKLNLSRMKKFSS
jgi:hypothetical protein